MKSTSMKTFFTAAAITLLAASCTDSSREVNPILQIEGGKVQGIVSENTEVLVYKGIPFAAPPVGELRWKTPQPVIPWDTLMIADDFRNACCQAAHNPNDGNYGTEFFATDAPYSEDCLYLNVWTPKTAAGKPETKLPVALWIHGGGYSAGWSFEVEMDGNAWAQRDVILVTANYRLGIMGFMTHPLLTQEGGGHSGNYGTYDQIAALDWVKNNIAQFGGDPENVTIFGQSAGGRSIKNLVASPLSRNKISRAIIQSVNGYIDTPNTESRPLAQLDSLAKAKLDRAGITTLEQLRSASWEELVKATARTEEDPTSLSLRPHQDDVLFPEDFKEATDHKTLADVPYMIGYTANDMPGKDEGLQRFADIREGLSEHPTYLYLFDRPLPTDGRPALEGSFHSSELWYMFGTLKRSWRPFTAKDEKLSEQMLDYWTNFCKNGNPNGTNLPAWNPSTKEQPFMMHFKID